MKLYFRDNKDELEFITEIYDYRGVISSVELNEIITADLENRKPGFASYYNRFWLDDNDDMWIDFGSHTEFYVLKKE